ncbi:MAG TPA: M23 family metallopeptidase [Bacteroidia bacterium]|nr:M23 family metallopeptidase [Bacteroidia bacterium]
MPKFKFVYLFFVLTLHLNAQVKPEFIWPLDSPRVITGNFGEIRPNHFHTGLDFSTNGKENLQVYAIEEGYVSRIKISSTGYGKVLYITHHNGKTSVYAHLNEFSLKINRELREEQNAKLSYEVDFYLRPYHVFVNRNEIIGLSGNTGASTGPHLHFELRDEKTEMPLNPLTVYHFPDHTAPVLEQIAFYNLEDTLNPQLLQVLPASRLNQSADTFELSSPVLALAFNAYDQCVESGNHNNVYAMRLNLDTSPYFEQHLDKIDFRDNRYANEYAEYHQRAKLQKCFLPEYYPAYLYGSCRNKGRLLFQDNKAHKLDISMSDESGNSTALRFYIRSSRPGSYKPLSISADSLVNCLRDTVIHQAGLTLYLPAYSFFHSFLPRFENKIESSGILRIEPSALNLRNAVQLAIPIPASQRKVAEHLVLRSSGQVYCPQQRNDSLLFPIRNFGSFTLLTDRQAPSAKTSPVRRGRILHNGTTLRFRIEDDLSGIANYRLFINDAWVPAEFDLKSNNLTYTFDESSPTGTLRIRLELSDRANNSSAYDYIMKR